MIHEKKAGLAVGGVDDEGCGKTDFGNSVQSSCGGAWRGTRWCSSPQQLIPGYWRELEQCRPRIGTVDDKSTSVQENEVFPLSVQLDAVSHAIEDAVLGSWITSEVSHHMFSFAVLFKDTGMWCGCRQLCSCYALSRILSWSLTVLADGQCMNVRHNAGAVLWDRTNERVKPNRRGCAQIEGKKGHMDDDALLCGVDQNDMIDGDALDKLDCVGMVRHTGKL